MKKSSPNGNKLIILSAPSGAGKTTLCQRLLSDYPAHLKLSVSSTTRPPRKNERHGVHYYFVGKEEFEAQIQKGSFAEWALVHGNYYGTSLEMIEDFLNTQHSVLLDIDVQGADSLKKRYGSRCVTIFVAPPNMEALEARLRSRGTDSEEVIQRRIRNARQEMERSREFDHVIVNDDLERAYAELRRTVESELSL